MTFFVGDYVKIHAPSKVTGVFMSAILFALIGYPPWGAV